MPEAVDEAVDVAVAVLEAVAVVEAVAVAVAVEEAVDVVVEVAEEVLLEVEVVVAVEEDEVTVKHTHVVGTIDAPVASLHSRDPLEVAYRDRVMLARRPCVAALAVRGYRQMLVGRVARGMYMAWGEAGLSQEAQLVDREPSRQ